MQVEDNDELAKFREEWRAEVRARADTSELPKEVARLAQTEAIATPVELYRRAAIAEESGQLDEALQLYKRAFRREPNVDKIYAQEERAKARILPTSPPKYERSHAPITSELDVATQKLSEINLQYPKGRSPELEAVLKAFPDELMFIAQDELSLSPLEALPLEVIIDILMHLAYRNDTTAIERFAGACRKARAVTLDPHIWRSACFLFFAFRLSRFVIRYLVKKTYVPPQVPEESFQDVLVSRFRENYRQLYIQHPRLRLDGVYIAVCHYM